MKPQASAALAEASVRARHLFRQFVKSRGVSESELPDYQAQAREVLVQYGGEYTERWLQDRIDDLHAPVLPATAASSTPSPSLL